MKAVIKFNLDDPEDVMAHKRCVKASDMAQVIWEFIYNTRKNIEWELESTQSNKDIDIFDLIFQKFNVLLEENNIIIDELIQ